MRVIRPQDGKEERIFMSALKKVDWKRTASAYFWITVGSILYGFAFDWFYTPNLIGYGGITGVGQVVNAFIPAIPIGMFVLVINIPLFILGWKFIGGHLLITSLYSMVLSSIAVDVFAMLIDFQPMDQMLAAICGGALIGLSLGIIFAKGATTGGTDLIARLVKLKLPWISMGNMLLVIDTAVVVLVALAFGNLTTALYGFIAQVVCAYVTDMVLYGLDTAKVAYIISDKAHAISDSIVEQMDRGVTVLSGKGAYSGENKFVLMCAFKQKEIVELKEIIFDVDPKAFIIVCDAHEVTGNGFKTYQKNDI